jgi:hypothetical protein
MKINFVHILILAGILVLVFLLIFYKSENVPAEKIYLRDTVEKFTDKIIYKTAKPVRTEVYINDTAMKPAIIRAEKSGRKIQVLTAENDTVMKFREYKTYGDFIISSDTGGVTVRNKVISFDGVYASIGVIKNFSTGKGHYYIGTGISFYIYDLNFSLELKYSPIKKNYLLEAGMRIYF